MLVKDLMDALSTLNPNAVVKAFDPDDGEDMPVTGYCYNSEEIILCTDDPDSYVMWTDEPE